MVTEIDDRHRPRTETGQAKHYVDHHDRFHCRHNSACPLARSERTRRFHTYDRARNRRRNLPTAATASIFNI
jgi:hypothetical protein